MTSYPILYDGKTETSKQYIRLEIQILWGEESNWYKTSKAGHVFCPLTRADGECVGSDYWDHPAKEDPSHHDT